MTLHQTLILPGWQNSGPQHWQSRWERHYGYQRVQQHDWNHPLRGDWITHLEEVVLSLPADQPVLLVAHSLGCHLVAAWAAISQNAHHVKGALLVAPPDVGREDLPPDLYSWRRAVLAPLPFAATCVMSSNDPFSGLDVSCRLASAWGARGVQIGARGHVNGESGLGDWPQGQQLLAELHQPVQTN